MPRSFRQGVVVGVALISLLNWTVNQYMSRWAGKRVFDYVKSTLEEQTTEPHGSTLTEPWSKVSYRLFMNSFLSLLVDS